MRPLTRACPDAGTSGASGAASRTSLSAAVRARGLRVRAGVLFPACVRAFRGCDAHAHPCAGGAPIESERVAATGVYNETVRPSEYMFQLIWPDLIQFNSIEADLIWFGLV